MSRYKIPAVKIRIGHNVNRSTMTVLTGSHKAFNNRRLGRLRHEQKSPPNSCDVTKIPFYRDLIERNIFFAFLRKTIKLLWKTH